MIGNPILSVKNVQLVTKTFRNKDQKYTEISENIYMFLLIT